MNYLTSHADEVDVLLVLFFICAQSKCLCCCCQVSLTFWVTYLYVYKYKLNKQL